VDAWCFIPNHFDDFGAGISDWAKPTIEMLCNKIGPLQSSNPITPFIEAKRCEVIYLFIYLVAYRTVYSVNVFCQV